MMTEPNGENHSVEADPLVGLDNDMRNWAASNHLSVETVSILVSQGFINLELCGLLSGDGLQQISGQVRPMAQQLALTRAVNRLSSGMHSTSLTDSGPVPQQSSGAAAPHGALNLLAQAATATAGNATTVPIDSVLNHVPPPGISPTNPFHPTTQPIGVGMAENPQAEGAQLFLRPLADVPYLKILDHVRPVLGGPRDDEEKLGVCDGGTLVFRPHKSQKKLEQVTKEQWFAAALRIMDALSRAGKLPSHLVPDYLGYLIQITDLAQQYLWHDVLLYDDLYRREQAKLCCKWGAPIATLGRLWLQPRSTPQNVGHKPLQSSRKPPAYGNGNTYSRPAPQKGPLDAQTGREICLAFNKGACRFGTECKYVHVCSVPGCGKSHAKPQHPSPSQFA
jgi:hypothetical protein